MPMSSAENQHNRHVGTSQKSAWRQTVGKVTFSQCLPVRAASTIPIVFIQLAIQIPSANVEDIASPNQQSSLTPPWGSASYFDRYKLGCLYARQCSEAPLFCTRGRRADAPLQIGTQIQLRKCDCQTVKRDLA